MAAQPKFKYTPDEYLALERAAEYKSEYIDGEIFAMSGVSRQHDRIQGNVYASLYQQLSDSPCEPFTSDMRVRVTSRRTRFVYPDATVVCGEAQFEDDQVDILINPTVVFEVLSKSTAADDRGEKAEFYRAMPSLSDYVLIAQDRVHVEHYARQADNRWALTEYNDLDATLAIESIGCQLPLRQVYRRVELTDEE